MKYALYPETNISIQVIWGLKKQNTVFTVGKSIFNRTSDVNIGELMLEYGGGGHFNAGTCQIDNNIAGEKLIQIIERIKK
jgi:nanoRNase/pAp phosphatase (c-di-AMP/oligoRNAs hydrolase)